MESGSEEIVKAMKNMTIDEKTKKPPPPLKPCKQCRYNIGSDETQLCATCDPNHRWWKKTKD